MLQLILVKINIDYNQKYMILCMYLLSLVSESSDCVHKPVDMPYQDVGTVSLPTFLSLLKQDGLLIFEPRVVDRCCELYEFARYRDGVSFSQ